MSYTRTELLQEKEWRRCGGTSTTDVDAFVHFCTYHAKIQHPERGAILFDLRPAQLEAIQVWMTERDSIVLKARQIGWSTLVAVYALWLAMFYDDKLIVMLSIGQREAEKLLKKADYAYKRLVPWMKERAPKRITFNVMDIEFDNGSKIESLPSKDDPARGSAVSLIIVDEWAFFDNAEEAWSAIEPVSDVGGRVIGLSTANGAGNFFHDFWIRARTGVSRFKPLFFPWWANNDRDEAWYEGKRANMQEWQLNQEYPATEEEAFIKSGRPVFDVDILNAQHLEVPLRGELSALQGGLRSPEFRELKNGAVRIWEFPELGKQYVIGVDIAEGLEHGDFTSMHVLSVSKNKVVASWHGHIDVDLAAEEAAKLGYYYNTALVGIEANNHGLATCKAIQRLHYPRLYYRRTLDQRTKKQRLQIGWYTSVASKPILVDELIATVREDLKIMDGETIAEMKFYQRDEKGRMSGAPFDDRVMSLGVAVQMLAHSFDHDHVAKKDLAGTYKALIDGHQRQLKAEGTRPLGHRNVRSGSASTEAIETVLVR